MSDKSSNTNKKHLFRHKECLADLSTCIPISNLIMANMQQIILSATPIELNAHCLNILADQNNFNVHIIRTITETGWDLHISYDINDMIDALNLLERSIIEN